MNLKGTKTAENLLKAFSQANPRHATVIHIMRP